MNAVHDEFVSLFKTLPDDTQRLLHQRYEIRIRSPTLHSDDGRVRVDSVDSEDGWKEIGRKHKVSTTRTVHHPPPLPSLLPGPISPILILAIDRRIADYPDIHWKSPFHTTKAGTQRLHHPGTVSATPAGHSRSTHPLRNRCTAPHHDGRNTQSGL